MEEKKKKEPFNCLTNEKVIVRHINRPRGHITDPKHVLYGGMAETAVRIFTVPQLESGVYVNVLTNDEKSFLELEMGLEENALSVHKKHNNFWDNTNPNGVNKVRLAKHDTYLDLSSPEDYIRYKILMANKDYIAKSYQDLQDTPKNTYLFVLVREGDDSKLAKQKLSITSQCYKEFGKIEDDVAKLRLIIETIDGRSLLKNTKKEFLQGRIYDLIQSDSKLFLKIITDPTLPVKVLIRESVDAGLISKRGDYYYLKADNSPLCEENEEPTFSVAARYLSNPKRQEIKFALEAKLK